MKERTRFFLYQELNDNLPLGEQILLLFATKDDAEAHLKRRVLELEGRALESLREDPEYATDWRITLDDDYVCIVPGKVDYDGADIFSIECLDLESPEAANENKMENHHAEKRLSH